MSDDVFEKYELIRRLRTGGMGEILLARQKGVSGDRRTVIIKMILPHLAQDPEFISRFTDETRIAANLFHGNIVTIFESGCWEGRFFMVMEHVDGPDLKELLARGHRLRSSPSWQPFCIHVLAETARALAYAHDKKDEEGRPLGIVHRDVSPSNILVSREGLIKLTDFGVAKAAQRSSVTMPGKLHGKVNYMAPEQVRGLECDHRSDIFSLGVTGYEMLAGVRPFEGDSDVGVLEKIRSMKFVPLTEAAPEVPDGLAAIVTRAMEADPVARWQSAEELSAALLDFAHSRQMTLMSRDVAALIRPVVDSNTENPPDGGDLDRYLQDALGETRRTPSAGSIPYAPSKDQHPRERTVTISGQIDNPVPTEPGRTRNRWKPILLALAVAAMAGLAGYLLTRQSETPADAISADATDVPVNQDAVPDAQSVKTVDVAAAGTNDVSPYDRNSAEMPGHENVPPPPTDNGVRATAEPRGNETADKTAAHKRKSEEPDTRRSDATARGIGDGKVIFRFFPADATVKIDGRQIQTEGNLVRLDLSAGDHTLSISTESGTPPRTRSFTIVPGETLPLGTIEVDADRPATRQDRP